jgi:hypothetical protein
VSGEVTSSFNLTMTSCLKNCVLLEFVFHVRRFNGKVGRCPFCCGEWEGAVTKSVNKAYRHRYNLAFLTRSAPAFSSFFNAFIVLIFSFHDVIPITERGRIVKQHIAIS